MQSYSAGGSKGSNKDTMAKVDKRIDLEALLSKRMNDNYDYINDAYTLLYGVSQLGDGGICQLMSSSIYADLLQWRYLQCLTWSDVSERLLTPVRTLQQLEREVFETIDEENYIEKFLKNK